MDAVNTPNHIPSARKINPVKTVRVVEKAYLPKRFKRKNPEHLGHEMDIYG